MDPRRVRNYSVPSPDNQIIKPLETRRNSRSTKPSPENNRRTTRGSIASPTNVLTSWNRNSKDQKTAEQPKKKASEPLKSILKKEKSIKEEETSGISKSKRSRDRDTVKSDLPVKRVKIEVTPGRSRSLRSPPRSTRSKTPESIACQVCRRRFPSKYSLNNHMRTHPSEAKNVKNKGSPPIGVTRSRDMTVRSQPKGKIESNSKHRDTFKCNSCGREYMVHKSLRRHEAMCPERKRDVHIDPELMAKVRPLQIRVARCDPLLLKPHSSVSEMSQVFGLDKNCVYPYLSRTIKTEPTTGRDGMVRIDDEVKEEFDDAHYVHWDSDCSSDMETNNYEPFTKKKRIVSLSTLTLKTIFSPRYLGRVRRKKRKIKSELIPEITKNKDIFTAIDSFDVVHDLERLNDNSFDQLFGNDDDEKISDSTDAIQDGGLNKGNSNNEEDCSLNKEGNGNNEEDGSQNKERNINNKENESVKELNAKCKERSEISDRLDECNVTHNEDVSDKDSEGAKNFIVNEEISDNTKPNTEANENIKENLSKLDTVEDKATRENQPQNKSNMDVEESTQKPQKQQIDENIAETDIASDPEKFEESNNSPKTNITDCNDEIEKLEENSVNADLKENTKSVDIPNEEKMETDENQTQSKIDSVSEVEESIQKSLNQEKSTDLNKESAISSDMAIERNTKNLTTTENKEEKTIDFVPKTTGECNTSEELITERDLLGVDGSLRDSEMSRDSIEFDEKFPELDEKEVKDTKDPKTKDINSFNMDIEVRKDNLVNSEVNDLVASLKDIRKDGTETCDEAPIDVKTKSEYNKPKIEIESKNILRNNTVKDKLSNHFTNTEGNERTSEIQEINTEDNLQEEFEETEFSQKLENIDGKATKQKDVYNSEENEADGIMKDILNKVKEDTERREGNGANTEDHVNNLKRQKDYNLDDGVMELEDQKLMEELDAQIGEDLMENFSEDSPF